jgi:hypothetical protein
MNLESMSHQNPFTPSLNEFVQKQRNIRKNKAANVKAKELSSMTGAEFETNLSFVRVSKAWVLNLTCNLICTFISLRVCDASVE